MRTHLCTIQTIILLFCFTQVGLTQVTSEKLIEAISKRNADEVNKLLENGANVNELSIIGASPIIHAIWVKDIIILKILVSKGADVNLNTKSFGCALNIASSMGAGEIAIYLIENGANINCQDKEGKTPLMSAIYDNHPELVKLLIDAGADVNLKGELDWTALMFATMRGDLESVKSLIDAKADVNSKTKDGETSLQRATILDYKEIIEVLKNAGAK